MTKSNNSKLIAGILALAMALVVGVAAQSGSTNQMKSNAKPKTEKTHKAPAARTDAEIQECISQKLVAAPKLKDQGFSASVTNGAATFTGMANNNTSKGAVHGIAKSCGARKIVNDITVKAHGMKKK